MNKVDALIPVEMLEIPSGRSEAMSVGRQVETCLEEFRNRDLSEKQKHLVIKVSAAETLTPIKLELQSRGKLVVLPEGEDPSPGHDGQSLLGRPHGQKRALDYDFDPIPMPPFHSAQVRAPPRSPHDARMLHALRNWETFLLALGRRQEGASQSSMGPSSGVGQSSSSSVVGQSSEEPPPPPEAAKGPTDPQKVSVSFRKTSLPARAEASSMPQPSHGAPAPAPPPSGFATPASATAASATPADTDEVSWPKQGDPDYVQAAGPRPPRSRPGSSRGAPAPAPPPSGIATPATATAASATPADTDEVSWPKHGDPDYVQPAGPRPPRSRPEPKPLTPFQAKDALYSLFDPAGTKKYVVYGAKRPFSAGFASLGQIQTWLTEEDARIATHFQPWETAPRIAEDARIAIWYNDAYGWQVGEIKQMGVIPPHRAPKKDHVWIAHYEKDGTVAEHEKKLAWRGNAFGNAIGRTWCIVVPAPGSEAPTPAEAPAVAAPAAAPAVAAPAPASELSAGKAIPPMGPILQSWAAAGDDLLPGPLPPVGAPTPGPPLATTVWRREYDDNGQLVGLHNMADNVATPAPPPAANGDDSTADACSPVF